MHSNSLAQASLPASNSATSIGWLVLGLASLALAALAILKVVEHFKGSKPSAQDLQHFATKKEHFALSQRVDKIEDESTFQTGATQRALGRIEGELKSLNK